MPNSNAREIFMRNLRHYMDLRHATQADISAALHVTPSTMSDWYLGKKYPRVDSMQRLADFLDIPMSALTTEPSTPAPRAAISDEDIKFALFGGDQEITDEQFAEVKRYALYLKERAANDRAKPR